MGKFKHLKNPFYLFTATKSLRNQLIRRRFPPIKPFGLNGTDYVGTLSSYYSSKLVERGLLHNKLRAVGLARFDRIVSFQRDNLESYKLHKLADKSQIRVLFPQVWGYEFGGAFSGFSSVAGELEMLSKLANYFFDGHVRITYRLRFGENMGNYQEYVKSLKNIAFEESKCVSPYDSIIGHDILISTGSTMLLEALALKRYGILYSPLRNDYFGYVSSGSCLMAWDSETVAKAIQQIIAFPDIQHRLQRNSERHVKDRAMVDGLASERTCSFIEDIIENRI